MPSSIATAFMMLLAISAGACIAVQQVVNFDLRNAIGSSWWAGLVSYLGGTVFMLAAIVVTRTRAPTLPTLREVPPVLWVGGILGGAYIALSLYLLPRLGVALALALIIVGQMVASMTFDQFGLFGVPSHTITPLRVAGAIALVAGATLIKLG